MEMRPSGVITIPHHLVGAMEKTPKPLGLFPGSISLLRLFLSSQTFQEDFHRPPCSEPRCSPKREQMKAVAAPHPTPGRTSLSTLTEGRQGVPRLRPKAQSSWLS